MDVLALHGWRHTAVCRPPVCHGDKLMKAIAQTIMVIFALTLLAAVAAAAYSMSEMSILKDERQIIAATTNCGKDGIRISIFKEGDQANVPCDDRELSRLMLLSGMPDQARYKECVMPDALRDFATVSNCLNFATVGSEKVLADVRAKSLSCGGEPKRIKFWKHGKYHACMGALL